MSEYSQFFIVLFPDLSIFYLLINEFERTESAAAMNKVVQHWMTTHPEWHEVVGSIDVANQMLRLSDVERVTKQGDGGYWRIASDV